MTATVIEARLVCGLWKNINCGLTFNKRDSLAFIFLVPQDGLVQRGVSVQVPRVERLSVGESDQLDQDIQRSVLRAGHVEGGPVVGVP